MLINIFWSLYKNSNTLRIRALLGHSFHVRLRSTRVLRGYFCIYISFDVNWTRALLGHITLSQSPKSSRITWPLFSGQTSVDLAYYATFFVNISPDVHRSHALLGHITLSQSPKSSRIIWPLSKNSCTPKNPRISWQPFSGQTSFNSRITRLFMYLYQSWRPVNSRITWPPYLKSESEELANYLAVLFRLESKEPKC